MSRRGSKSSGELLPFNGAKAAGRTPRQSPMAAARAKIEMAVAKAKVDRAIAKSTGGKWMSKNQKSHPSPRGISKSKSRDPALEDAPKVRGESNTDMLDDRSSSSYDFRLNKDQDNSEKDQECDSSASDASGSGTQKTETTGILDNERGDKIISYSRMMFFGILIVSMLAVSIAAFLVFRHQQTIAFEKEVRAVLFRSSLMWFSSNIDRFVSCNLDGI